MFRNGRLAHWRIWACRSILFDVVISKDRTLPQTLGTIRATHQRLWPRSLLTAQLRDCGPQMGSGALCLATYSAPLVETAKSRSPSRHIETRLPYPPAKFRHPRQASATPRPRLRWHLQQRKRNTDMAERDLVDPVTPLSEATIREGQSSARAGLASKMEPRPDHGETSYKGSGRADLAACAIGQATSLPVSPLRSAVERLLRPRTNGGGSPRPATPRIERGADRYAESLSSVAFWTENSISFSRPPHHPP